MSKPFLLHPQGAPKRVSRPVTRATFRRPQAEDPGAKVIGLLTPEDLGAKVTGLLTPEDLGAKATGSLIAVRLHP